MLKRTYKSFKAFFPFSWRDSLVTVLILAGVSGICFLLRTFGGNYAYAPMLFLTAIFLISRYTSGYLFGLISSAIGVFLVNYIFTFPYFAFNFTISGYPITFISMFATSVMTSAMTTRIKLQEELRIEAAREKMRGNLLRAVSHDLRTPLTSIIGTVSALIDDEGRLSDSQQKQLLIESRDDAEWLIRMVENLLSITRMNGGETRLIKSAEAAEEMVGEALRKFQKRFPGIGVSVSAPDELLMVPADAMLVEQVLINLLENAVLHGMATDNIELSVVKDGHDAVFIVSDSGVGIPESSLPHLFDGYLSESAVADADSKRNMGIGLSVCMSIAKAHGGSLSAKNKSEGGAEFRFSLPLEE